MKINVGEVTAAGAIVAFGLVALWLGSSYSIGTLGQMGPGYFPVILGGFTVLVGLATVVHVRRSDAPAPNVAVGPAALVLGGLLAWALTAERFGLVPATFAVVILSAFAKPPVRLVPLLGMAVIASALCVVVFVYGFGLPLRPFKW
jgi:hypothetical protein